MNELLVTFSGTVDALTSAEMADVTDAVFDDGLSGSLWGTAPWPDDHNGWDNGGGCSYFEWSLAYNYAVNTEADNIAVWGAVDNDPTQYAFVYIDLNPIISLLSSKDTTSAASANFKIWYPALYEIDGSKTSHADYSVVKAGRDVALASLDAEDVEYMLIVSDDFRCKITLTVGDAEVTVWIDGSGITPEYAV